MNREEFEKKLSKILDRVPFGKIIIILMIAGIISLFKYTYDLVSVAIINYQWQEGYFTIARGYYPALVSGENLHSNMNANAVLKSITHNLPIKKYCKNSAKEGCWPKKSYFVDNSEVTWNKESPGFILINGLMISHIQSTGIGCDQREICSAISFDVNGLNGPNKFGKDEFRVYYYTDKISPYHPFEDGMTGDIVKKFLNIK